MGQFTIGISQVTPFKIGLQTINMINVLNVDAYALLVTCILIAFKNKRYSSNMANFWSKTQGKDFAS